MDGKLISVQSKLNCNYIFKLEQYGSWTSSLSLSFHGKGCRSLEHNLSLVLRRQCTLHYSAMSSCGWLKSQTAASWRNVVPDLWIWRASLLLLALHVVHEGVGSEVAAKLSCWHTEWDCDWCGNAEGSSPTLSIMRLDWKCDAVKCVYTQRIHTCNTSTRIFFSEYICVNRGLSTTFNSHTFSPKCPSIFLSAAADANQLWQPKLTALSSLSVASSFHIT